MHVLTITRERTLSRTKQFSIQRNHSLLPPPLVTLPFSLSIPLHRHNAKPRLAIQKRENLEIALEFMTKVEKIRLENIGESLTSDHTHSRH